MLLEDYNNKFFGGASLEGVVRQKQQQEGGGLQRWFKCVKEWGYVERLSTRCGNNW